MKRAWPYAVALAVVVTGCYLALTPLLRSLSPGATTSSSSLQQQSDDRDRRSSRRHHLRLGSEWRQHDRSSSALPKTAKKAKKKAATAPTATHARPASRTTGVRRRLVEHAGASPRRPVKTAKTKPVKKGGGSVNGTVDTGNGGGLASPGSNAPVNGGTHSDPAGN